MLGGEGGQFFHRLASQCRQVDRFVGGEDLTGIGAGQGEQTVDEFGKVDGFVEIAAKSLEQERMIGGFAECDLDFAAKDREGRAEFVGGIGDEALLGHVDLRDTIEKTVAGAHETEGFGIVERFLKAGGLQSVVGDTFGGSGGGAERMGFTTAQPHPKDGESGEGCGDTGQPPPALVEWTGGVVDAHGGLKPGADEGTIGVGIVVIHRGGRDEPRLTIVRVEGLDPGGPNDIGCVQSVVDPWMIEDLAGNG